MKKVYILMLLAVVCMFTTCNQKEAKKAETKANASVRPAPEGIVLENSQLRAVFDKGNGALIDFTNKVTGWSIQNRPELGLSFQLLVPIPDKRNNPVYGAKQKLAKFEMSPDNKTVNFYWGNITSERAGVLDINLKGTVSLADNGLTFNMSVDNKSKYTVEAVAYPIIGDLPLPDSKETLDGIRVGYSGMDRNPILPGFPNWKGYYGVDYPIMMFNIPELFMLVATNTQGLYIGSHDISLKELVSYTFELKPGWGVSHGDGYGDFPKEGETGKIPARVEFRIWHFPFVNSNETATLSPIVLNPYKGSWHYGVDNYKAWRKTWFKYPNTPQWAKEVHSWQQIHINSPEDELRCQYKDLVKYGEECAKHGVKAIQLVGWNNGGQDRGNPSHDTDPRLGTWKDLKDAIAKIEALGVHIILFNKYTWADRSTEWFRKELIKYACKDPYGDYHVYDGYQYQTPVQLSDINTIRLIPMCQNCEKWREIANKEFKKGIDLGASGMLYDECAHHGGAEYCWDKSHGHHVPEFTYSGDVPLAKGFRKITDKLKPDYMYAGEACNELQNTQYSLAYFRIDPFNHVALKRYIDPQGLLMVAAVGFNDRVMLNACLRYRYVISYEPYNFKGHLDDFPLTIDYGKKIDALRKMYTAYVWDGEFRDVLEATVTSNGKPYESYSVYRHAKENKHAVVIVNNDKNNEAEVEVKIDNSTQPMVYVTPENTNPTAVAGKIKIPPLSVVMVMEK